MSVAKRRWLLAALLTLVAVPVTLAVWYRATYANWPGQGPPERLHWCGRIYERGDGHAQSRRAVAGSGPLYPADFRAPPLIGHRVFSGYTAAEARHRTPTGVGCGTVVLLKVARDRYVPYALLGGP
jgi:hypothetical protein